MKWMLEDRRLTESGGQIPLFIYRHVARHHDNFSVLELVLSLPLCIRACVPVDTPLALMIKERS